MSEKLGFLIQTAYQRTVPVPSQKRHAVPTYRTRTRDGNRSGRPAGRVAGRVEILRPAGQAG